MNALCLVNNFMEYLACIFHSQWVRSAFYTCSACECTISPLQAYNTTHEITYSQVTINERFLPQFKLMITHLPFCRAGKCALIVIIIISTM